jgi:hypothetical protein
MGETLFVLQLGPRALAKHSSLISPARNGESETKKKHVAPFVCIDEPRSSSFEPNAVRLMETHSRRVCLLDICFCDIYPAAKQSAIRPFFSGSLSLSASGCQRQRARESA